MILSAIGTFMCSAAFAFLLYYAARSLPRKIIGLLLFVFAFGTLIHMMHR